MSRLLLHIVNDRRRSNTHETAQVVVRITSYIHSHGSVVWRSASNVYVFLENRFNLATSRHWLALLAGWLESGFDVVPRCSNDKQMAKVLSVHKSSVSISGKKRIIGIRHCVYIVDCIYTFARGCATAAAVVLLKSVIEH